MEVYAIRVPAVPIRYYDVKQHTSFNADKHGYPILQCFILRRSGAQAKCDELNATSDAVQKGHFKPYEVEVFNLNLKRVSSMTREEYYTKELFGEEGTKEYGEKVFKDAQDRALILDDIEKKHGRDPEVADLNKTIMQDMDARQIAKYAETIREEREKDRKAMEGILGKVEKHLKDLIPGDRAIGKFFGVDVNLLSREALLGLMVHLGNEIKRVEEDRSGTLSFMREINKARGRS